MKPIKAKTVAALAATAAAFLPAVASAADGKGIGLHWGEVLATAVYGILGIVLAISGYFLFELVTPFSVKKELTEDDNLAMGVVVGSMFLGVSIIVAAAIL
jgi:putative membrane protein